MGQDAREREHTPDHRATEVRYNADGTSHRGAVGLGAESGLPARPGILSSIAQAGMRIPTKPAMHSNLMSATTYSHFIPAGIPI